MSFPAANTGKLAIAYFVPNWFGDGLMAWPGVFKHIKDTPDSRHVLIMKPGLKGLWKYLTSGIEVEILTYADSFRSMKELVQDLKNLPIAAIYVLTETPRNHLMAYFSNAPRTRGRKRGLTSGLLTEVLPPAKQTQQHRAENYFTILNSPADYQTNMWGPVELNTSLPEDISDLFQHTDTVALFPGAARGKSKQWPYFSELAEALHSQGIVPLVLGSPADAEAAKTVRYGVNLCGKLSIPELASLVANCKIAVSNDSGGMHLVDAIGTPLIAIFGLTNPAITGPRRQSSIVLKAPGRSAVAIKGQDGQAVQALASITVQSVLTQIDKIIHHQ